MSKAASPTRFSGELDHFYDPNFTAEISHKMRVPKRIRVDGEFDDDTNNHTHPVNPWNDKIEMHVPDRILVIGQEQHLGTKAPPRELVLENSILPPPPDPGVVRVQTPPRVITLDEYAFPSAGDYVPDQYDNNEGTYIVEHPKFQKVKHIDIDTVNRMDIREGTPGLSESMTTNEEVVHLRRQLAKLNRRVMSIELENLQRQQREKMLYAIGIAYFFFKVLFWLNRSS